MLNHREENVINVIIKLQISSEEIDDRTMSRMFRIILVNRWINFLIGDVFMRKELGKCSNLSLPLEVTITIHNFSVHAFSIILPSRFTAFNFRRDK